MTKARDGGRWIAAASVVAVAAAIAAGLLAIPSPLDARAEHLDEALLRRMNEIAAAARCAYTFTGRVPANLAEIDVAFREREQNIPACAAIAPAPDARGVVYAAEASNRIRLCGEFRRASARDRAPSEAYRLRYPGLFPELEAPRPAAGQHCYSVLLRPVEPAD